MTITWYWHRWRESLFSSHKATLTSEAGRGHLPGKHFRPGFRWNTSHRSGTCQQEAHILVNYTFAISTANHREGTKKQPPIRAGQDRPGGGHTGGGRGQGRSSPGGSSQSWCRVFVWADVLILHVNFGVDDWSHQNRPMQTSQALKKEGEKEKRGKGGKWGEGSKWIFFKKRREIICYRSDKDNGGGREGRENRRRWCKQQPRGQRAKAKQRLASDIQW